MFLAQDLKARLADQDIEKILIKLGAKIYLNNSETIISSTICHNGKSPKLYYYKHSKQFYCFTKCGDSFDIIELVCRVRKYNMHQSINWIAIQLGLESAPQGFGLSQDIITDWTFINNYRIKKQQKVERKVDFYNGSIMNIFQYWYCKEWVDENISIHSMEKYNIKYSTWLQKIIIPHYDIDYRLLGIRGRAMLEDEVELYGKYAPIHVGGVMYSHPLSLNLYGIHMNKETIKRKKKVLLLESEKGVLQCDNYFKEDNFALALCGKNFSNFQLELLLSLGVEEVIIGLDKQFQDPNSEEAIKWSVFIREKIINKLAPYVRVYVLWDTEGLLGYKDAPTDLGKDTLLKLMENKICVGCYS